MHFIKRKNIFLKLFILLLFIVPSFVFAEATLGLSSTKQSFSAGDVFPVSVYVSSTESVNAFSGKISFPKENLSVESISKTGSIVNFWVSDPKFSNADGTIQFEGVALNPGFSGSNGKIITINFKANNTGSANILFSSGSVLANDGEGKDVLSKSGSLNLSIIEKTEIKNTTQTVTETKTSSGLFSINSPTHPDQSKWYNRSKAIISWVLPEDSLSVKATIDKNSNTIPDTDIGLVSSKQYDNLSDGVLYAHVRVKTKNGFGETAHFRLQIDTSPPRSFEISFPHGSSSEDPNPIMFFNTSDSLSGIDFYRIKVGENDYIKVDPKIVDSNPYTPPNQTPGNKNIIVEAYDKAGNVMKSNASFEIIPINPPKITSYNNDLIEGDLFKVRGETYPDSRVDIFIKDYDGNVITEFTKSNSSGDFALALSKHLQNDVYTLTAIVTDNRGAQSLESKPITFKVEQKPFIKIGQIVISYTILTLFILFIITIFIFVIWFIWYKFILFKKKIRKEVNDADKILHRAFKILRTDLEEQMDNLLKTKKKRELTKEEAKILSVFKKNFKDAEDILTKEIGDIEKTL